MFLFLLLSDKQKTLLHIQITTTKSVVWERARRALQTQCPPQKKVGPGDQYSIGTKRRKKVLDLRNKLRNPQSSEAHSEKENTKEQFISAEYPHIKNLRMISPDRKNKVEAIYDD